MECSQRFSAGVGKISNKSIWKCEYVLVENWDSQFSYVLNCGRSLAGISYHQIKLRRPVLGSGCPVLPSARHCLFSLHLIPASNCAPFPS